MPALLAPAPSGASRDAAPGFLLVAEEAVGRGRAAGTPVGFAHVLLLDDGWSPRPHLEQVSVRLPDRARQGTGTALVRAAMAEARWLGHDDLTLCTYRDLPWNGPFYARLGFVEVPEPPAYLEALRDHERTLGLDDGGVRVVMRASLRT